MKKNYLTFIASAAIFIAGFGMMILTSCEGPAGVAGIPGLDGQDATETCNQCHNDETVLIAKIAQNNHSVHTTGGSYEETRATCAPCHTHKGYLEVLNTGAQVTEGDMSNPLPANCRTCHMIHETNTAEDYALRANDPVELWINGVTVDLPGTGNSCVSCHQPRIPNPLPVLGGGNVTITSNRWGPHHGTQSAILYATAGYEMPGSLIYPAEGAHTHASQAGCNVCHMAEPVGAFAGGHTFSMINIENGDEHLAGCTGCHSDIESFDLGGKITEIENLSAQLRSLLIANGLFNADTELVNASSGSPLVIPSNQAGALLNYFLVVEDGSMGVHNPRYARALLQNSIEVFQ